MVEIKGVVAPVCNPSTREAEAGDHKSEVRYISAWLESKLNSKVLSQNIK